ncbi:SDR family oxidoreductase [Maribellus maritimus]|uniref:SDR family oxidoreductase n=1 Tax=Maribellus maritimus TaxID=2870838 RepID=UPI001EEC694A|nr:SDR family oxidoreductase [Maribellus maritimus]MCG6187141.1 SDR family oxidoreductase [Maribellus maritimus]
MKTEKVLIAGATGYLGRHITKQIVHSEYDSRLIVRDLKKSGFDLSVYDVVEAEVTKPETFKNIFNGVDYVISTVGITRQKDGLTYMDVDYQANVNLIDAARAGGVKKFIYVSVLNGQKLRHLKIGEAKEKLVDYLKNSGMDYSVIRPNGFFSDMADFLKMAKSGKVYLFGDGKLKLNPIHGDDLAEVCINALRSTEKEINVGGPDILSQNEIAELALKACSKPVKIVHLPDWIRKVTLWTVRTFTSSKTYGPIEFFLSTMVMEMVAPRYGTKKLEDFFTKKVKDQ